MITKRDVGLWRKSSYSGANGNCVEVARFQERALAVRDSKDPSGPVLNFSAEGWSAFLRGVKGGDFDH